MADFEYAFEQMKKEEGGYANDPRDPGGETYVGISRVFWPNWSGWSIIDNAKTEKNFPASLASLSSLSPLVNSFYRKNFWQFDGISDLLVASKLFDICVNLPRSSAIRLCQLAIRGVAGASAVSLDGEYGPATERAINDCDASALLSELRAQQAFHYATHAKPVFLLGLLRRAVK